MTLSEKILTFIEYCLPEIRFKFSYQKLVDVLQEIDNKKYSIATIRKEFSNLKRQGFIVYGKRYKKRIPLLTRKGKLQIAPSLPYKKFGQWDKRWRIVIFETPEKERKYRMMFQEKLKELGFQKIQKGVYISPHSLLRTVSRISTELGIRQYLTLVESDKIEREKRAIEQIWELDKINQEYQKFIKKARKIKKNPFWPLIAKRLEGEFAKIYQLDPHLPEELLPKNWLGDKAYKIYKEIVKSY